MSLNKVALMGRLTRNPELRHTQAGKSVANFSVAVDRDFEKNQTDFIEIVCWGNTADFVSSYFTKGRMAVVSGRLQMREWTDKDGNKRKVAEVVADNVYFGDSKKEDPLDQFTKAHPDSIAGGGFEDLADDGGELPF